MNEDRNVKPNYNDPEYGKDYYANKSHYDEQHSGTYDMYSPNNYDYSYRDNYSDSFYRNERDRDEDGGGGFLTGAIIGGLIGAAAALLLAPKSGKELRGDVSTQAVNLKEKGIELSSVAKDKTADMTKTVQEKTSGLGKSIQDQAGQMVDKVKSMKKGQSAPMDDGTVSSEGEEPIEFIDTVADKVHEAISTGQDKVNSTAEAMKDAVDEKQKQAKDMAKNSSSGKSGSGSGSGKSKSGSDSDLKDQHSGNTEYSYDNSENKGDNKVMGMNHISKIENDKKDNKNT
ncbi:YtxH domain-containing protein [Edaphobacillus lindanitolerans]|uniref:Gas vesicle protein n=1 Tax=Edaphobacillus lindanitolerans TaxID=550447 RepID=A0A1U7PKK6_9BACI|nr:YtxH domain-containing protein [Edaphobacillus lindanitolerans]SIT85393.1 Gas vesicle protein [Edaphobacillus lindanitolerans]